MTVDIRPLRTLTEDDLRRLVTGYTATGRYSVHKTETDRRISFTLELVLLAEPFVKVYDHLDADTLGIYQQALTHGLSLGAYDGDRLVALALAEPHRWNLSLWVWEFHVEAAYRGRGVGTQLMEVLAGRAREAGLRVIVCETQNLNASAIAFYRRAGFTLDALDLCYYTSADYPDGEIAVFMKRKL